MLMPSRPPLSTRCSPVGLDDLLPVPQGSFPVLHVQADAHSLVHHVQHVHIAILEHGAHLLLAKLADLQQLLALASYWLNFVT